MLSKEIKEDLYIEMEPIYREAGHRYAKNEIEKRIEVFAMALSLSNDAEEENLRTIEKDINDLLESILKKYKREISKENINLVEPYLRFLCLLTDKKNFYGEKYMEQKSLKSATILPLYRNKYIDSLETKGHPERKYYYNILGEWDENGEPYLYTDSRHAEKRFEKDIEIMPFVKTYCFRNAVIHYQPLPDDNWEHFMCMFYTMIEAAYKNKEIIIPKFIEKEIEMKEYIQKLIQDYQNDFGENFTYIPLSIDIFMNDMYESLKEKYDVDNDKSISFETINNDLTNPSFNKVKIIGYAGMGKTTTIRHVIYQEALEIKANDYNGKIPVLIELINVSNPESSIEKLIAQKLGTNNMIVISELIKRNMIKLYIDGINELMILDKREKNNYLESLEKFVKVNKNIKIVVTDRDSNQNSIMNEYPTFILKGITKEKITEFIMGNSQKPEMVNEKILQKIEERPSFMDVLCNPFMLKNLITVVECSRKVPEYEDDIAEEFLKAIVKREQIIKKDQNAPHILRLLIYVVSEYAKTNDIGDNMIISSFKLEEYFNQYCDKYKRKNRFDNDEMLNLIVKLGILKEAGFEKYTFTDEKYFNFFYYSAVDLLE